MIPAMFAGRKNIIGPEEPREGFKKNGQEITQELEYILGKLFVRKYIRPKYANPDKKQVLTGVFPAILLKKK